MTGNDPLRYIDELGDLGNIEVTCKTGNMPDFDELDPYSDLFSTGKLNLESEKQVSEEDLKDIFLWIEDEADFNFTPKVVAAPPSDAALQTDTTPETAAATPPEAAAAPVIAESTPAPSPATASQSPKPAKASPAVITKPPAKAKRGSQSIQCRFGKNRQSDQFVGRIGYHPVDVEHLWRRRKISSI